MPKKKYVKKPIVIEAMKFNGWNWDECQDWMAGQPLMHPQWIKDEDYIIVKTLEGDMKCNRGDYLIKGVKGEFYPCRADIFEETYTEVEE